MEQVYVKNLFNSIAKKYDFLNHFLSVGIDFYWRRKAVNLLKKSNPKIILDLATGTGDFAVALSKLNPNKIFAIDISSEMISVGIDKIAKKKLDKIISFEIGAAENMRFESNSIDAVTVGFGVRNFENLEKGLSEIYRVLKNNGQTAILEFSRPRNIIFKKIYYFYFKNILPLVGKLISKSDFAYQYLPESVMRFPDGEEFISIMKNVGFKNISEKRLTFGIVTIYFAVKD